MCLVKKAKVVKVKGKKALVDIAGYKKEVTVDGKVKKGDVINVFQSLGFK